MNQSYQTNPIGKQKYQKTFSSTNYQLYNYQESAKDPKPSFISTSPSQVPIMEAEFMMIEDGLSRNYNYIQRNLNRIPNFPSSEKAKEELERLLNQLHQMENAVTPAKHPNIEGRLSQITKQHQTLNDEEQRINELRSINNDDRARDDAEYEAIKNKIREAKEELARYERQISQFHEESTFVREKLDRAKNNLQSRQYKIEKLKEQENRLLKLQKQSRNELRDIQNELTNSTSEEHKISEIEARIEENMREFKRLSKVLSEKKEMVRVKTEKVQKLLYDANTLENRLDEAVNYAETMTEQKKQETYLNSDSEFNDFEKNLNVLSMNNSSINNSSIYNSPNKNKKSTRPPPITTQSDEEDQFNQFDGSHNFSDQKNASLYDNDNNNYSYQSSFRSSSLSKNKLNDSLKGQLSDENDDIYLNDNKYHQKNEPAESDDDQMDLDYSQKYQSPNSSQYQKIDQLLNPNTNKSINQLSNSNHSLDQDNYQLNQSHNSIYYQENEQLMSSDKYQTNKSHYSRYYQQENQYDNSTNSNHNQIQDQSAHLSDNDLFIEEEEEVRSLYSHTNSEVESISTNNDQDLSIKQRNSFKPTNFPSDDSDSDEENVILDNVKLDDNDEDDDDEDDEFLKSLSQRNLQLKTSFSSKGNSSDIANDAIKAINTSLIDNSSVVQKVENTTSNFKNNYM